MSDFVLTEIAKYRIQPLSEQKFNWTCEAQKLQYNPYEQYYTSTVVNQTEAVQ